MNNEAASPLRKRRRKASSAIPIWRVVEGGIETQHNNGSFLRPTETLLRSRSPTVLTASLKTHVHPTPVITHGCLLIPFAFMVWWYWTKRTVRRVVRGLLTSAGNNDACTGPAASTNSPTSAAATGHSFSNTSSDPNREKASAFDDADQFNSWEDVIHQEDSTLRFVRWFEGKDAGSTIARRRVHAATLNNLRGGPSTSPILSLSESSSDDMTLYHNACSNVPGHCVHVCYTWQCIQNTTGAGEGRCSIEARHSESSERLSWNDEILARSVATFEVVETVTSQGTVD